MLPNPIENLVKQLARLPGIGPKFAERLVFFLASQPKEYTSAIAYALIDFAKKIKHCAECGNISETGLCPICASPKRDRTKICVIESALDIIVLEKSGQYKGLYHVLGGVISPHKHIMPENLRIKQLVDRISKRNNSPAFAASPEKEKNNPKIQEIIIATNPNTEGDTTALYLVRVLSPSGVKITRLARGLPSGSELEYMDEATISSALAGRKDL
ncbi:recombination mediator RecR [Patescibacteria group bacterium]|nr:recombination mediator RecR [Patescibacteria group bacterium]MBU4580141.1 recombination mediator RecR [Patescibacteria group bacterium]